MSNLTKKNVGFSPFNCIALKDVKDKNSKNGDFRPLFDCVSAMSDCVTKLHDFLDNAIDQADSAKINEYVSALTNMQKDILSMCQSKIDRQNEYVPSQNPEAQPVQEGQTPELAADKASIVKTKVK